MKRLIIAAFCAASIPASAQHLLPPPRPAELTPIPVDLKDIFRLMERECPATAGISPCLVTVTGTIIRLDVPKEIAAKIAELKIQ